MYIALEPFLGARNDKNALEWDEPNAGCSDPNLRPSFARLTADLKPLQRLVIPSHPDQPTQSLQQEIAVNSTP
ncbi:hypothetical protein OIU77_004500 [Salix suchowensis]|uniref:Uncharacterized protein n=1 Tax=Salix suchowensis TaxID=1278906 RepID=A0ABQ9AUK8_9ROSI|nr:hypothetical protein OIU77_004500 [Salix suchowensis]